MKKLKVGGINLNKKKMGMFDTLYINIEKLPISDEEKQLIDTNQDWQTKSLKRLLSKVYITDDGELKLSIFNFEDSKYNDELETLLYDGCVNFYTNIGNDDLNWYEFNAIFINGKLNSITGGKTSY